MQNLQRVPGILHGYSEDCFCTCSLLVSAAVFRVVLWSSSRPPAFQRGQEYTKLPSMLRLNFCCLLRSSPRVTFKHCEAATGDPTRNDADVLGQRRRRLLLTAGAVVGAAVFGGRGAAAAAGGCCGGLAGLHAVAAASGGRGAHDTLFGTVSCSTASKQVAHPRSRERAAAQNTKQDSLEFAGSQLRREPAGRRSRHSLQVLEPGVQRQQRHSCRGGVQVELDCGGRACGV